MGDKKTEVWTYTGLRTLEGKRVHGWQDTEGKERLYSDKGTFVIGGRYTVTVEHADGHISRGVPQYTGDYADQADRQQWNIKDSAARAKLSRLAMERTDAKRDDLAATLKPIRELAATLRTTAERDALTSAVLRAIYGEW